MFDAFKQEGLKNYFHEQLSVGILGKMEKQIHKLPIFWASVVNVVLYIVVGLIVIFGIMAAFSAQAEVFAFLVVLYGIFGIYLACKASRTLLSALKRPGEILKENGLAYSAGRDAGSTNQNLDELETLISKTKFQSARSDAFKADLLTNVSHDLRTPLTNIITYGDLLSKKELSDKDATEYVGVINKNAERMKVLIDNLFDVTKMDNGDIELNQSEIDFAEFVGQAIAENSEKFDERPIKVVYKKPEAPIIISIDGDQMWRVLDNLLGNAAKYSLAGSRVYVKLAEDAKSVTLQVKNISAHELYEDADKLIERFQRGDASRTTEGAGLGLAIVDSIVKLHNGQLIIAVDGDMFKVAIVLPK
jgi:signal transduction histidine kinase